jgi:transcription initiation factor TFIIIB Brf1 subunit/transcription initiation factor TFIIB
MSSTSEDSVDRRLVEVAEKLQIANDTLQITQVRLNQLSNEPDVDEDNLDGVAATALALSCREDGLPVSEHDIEKAWSETLDSADGEVTISHQQLEAVGSYLDIDEVPPHPNALVKGFGEAVEMPEDLINVAHRLLYDCFEMNPSVIASGTSPAATAGAVLSLAASVNDEDDSYGQDALGKVSGTNEVTIRNRREVLEDLLGEDRLHDDRYRVGPSTTATETPEQSTAADGAGATETTADQTAAETDPAESEEETSETEDGEESEFLETVKSMYPDELPTTESVAEAHDASKDAVSAALAELSTSGTIQQKRAGSVTVWVPAEQDTVEADLTVDAVETEVDALVEELDIGASTRLLARGMVSDAVDDVGVEDAAELAGAVVVAAARMEDLDADTVEVAELREFEPRVLTQWLDTLEETVDVEIPRRDADEIIDEVADELGLSDALREESLTSLERYDGDDEYTAAELGAGAVMFAATVSATEVDVDEVSAISGADPDHITDAMNSVVVSLCLGLVSGDIEYEDCSWTTELLESELSPEIGDSYTGRVIALTKTYTAGREARYVDDGTIDIVLGEE